MQELLMLALSLLIAAQSPNVPDSVRNQAVSLAVYAIEVAQTEVVGAPQIEVLIDPVIEATTTEPVELPACMGGYDYRGLWVPRAGCGG